MKMILLKGENKMIKNIIKFIFRKKCKHTKEIESIISDEKKQKINEIWDKLDKMSGYGITIICLNTQENDLAVALAHSKEFIIKRFKGYLELNSKINVIKLIEKYKLTTNKYDGYRMKSYIINTHKERFINDDGVQ